MVRERTKERTEEINTSVGRGSVLDGTFNINSSLRVDGKVKGTLTAFDTLTVGEEGEVEAEVKVTTAVVSGKIVGTLEASDRIVLQAGSKMLGDLKTKLLVIEEGAIFKGNCDLGEDIEESRPKVEIKRQKKIEESKPEVVESK